MSHELKTLSIWEKQSFYAPKDVIIVGSGFVGLWSAFYLKKKNPKLNIAIVERGLIPSGASIRNAGFACFGSVTELLEDARTMGTDKMLELVEMRYRGLKRISKLFKESEIDFRICGGYDLINEHSPLNEKALKEKLQWLNEQLAGVVNKKRVFRFANDRIKAFGLASVQHMVENRLEGYLHSGKFCQSLLTLVQSLGVTVLNNIKIAGYNTTNSGIVLETNHGIELRSDQLLVCTNAFAKQLLPELDIVPARGQVLVTEPIKNLKLEGTFHYDHGFYYFRNLGNRVLIGGARNKAFEEETTTALNTTELIQNELERFLSAYILPGIPFEVSDRWSGIMAMGSEKMPIIQSISDNIFCAVRMSGMGVALAPVVGETVAGMM